jgi:hypothetical protein
MTHFKPWKTLHLDICAWECLPWLRCPEWEGYLSFSGGTASLWDIVGSKQNNSPWVRLS